VGLFGKSKAQQVQEATEQFSTFLGQRALAIPETLANSERFPREAVDADVRLVLQFCFQSVVDGQAPKDLGQNAGLLLGTLLSDLETRTSPPPEPKVAAENVLERVEGIRALQGFAERMSRPDVSAAMQRISLLWLNNLLATEYGQQAVVYLTESDEADIGNLLN